jgi:hypothetical protein
MADNNNKNNNLGEDGDEEKDKVTELRSSGGDDNASSDASKRNSLMVDDFPDFDPTSLEAEDDWGAVFDDDEDHTDLGMVPSSPLSESKAVAPVDSDDKDKNSHDKESTKDFSMPPPPSLTSRGSASSKSLLSSMPTSFSKIPSIEGLTKNRPPMDHSITRRKKTAGTADRSDSAPPSWHSEAADLTHRQAMVQDIAKLLYARKKGKNPSRTWLERVPLKAKMLESQLYKNAASLEAYLNRSTLKGRLGKLASAITSHYKQAARSRRSSTRSSASSISSLSSLENAFADARLRRESSSSVQSMPGLIKGNANATGNNLPGSAGKMDGGMLFGGNTQQSDSMLNALGSSNQNQSLSSLSGASNNANNSGSMVVQKGNNPIFAMGRAGTMNAPAGSVNNTGMTQQQQQFLASIRQQQQELARRMGGGSTSNNNGAMMNNQAAVGANNSIGMMGNVNFPMMNQQALLQQQQNAMNMSLLQQQQQQLQLLQQQQQQAMGPNGLSLHNIAVMQQQQQLQMQNQQQQNQMMGLGGASNNNTMGMDMMNANMVIPGVNAGRMQSMQTLLNQQLAMAGGNVGMNNMMDMMNMPPPGMANNTSPMNAERRQNSTGNVSINANASNNNNNDDDEEPQSPLSPGSFNW